MTLCVTQQPAWVNSAFDSPQTHLLHVKYSATQQEPIRQKMKEPEVIQIIKDTLTPLGYSIERISRSNFARKPDLFISKEEIKFMVELKTKGNNPTESELEYEKLKRGEVVSKITPLSQRSRFSGMISDAMGQLTSEEYDEANYRMIWIHFHGDSRSSNQDRFFKSLYGNELIIDADDFESSELKECYYFYYSEFMRHKNLDAVVLSDKDSLKVCLNEFSTNFCKLRKSVFCDDLRSGVVDPKLMIDENEIYFLREDEADRSDRNECLEILTQKYKGKRFLDFPMSEISSTTMVPKKTKVEQDGVSNG